MSLRLRNEGSRWCGAMERNVGIYDYGIIESWEREKGDEGALISVRWSRVSMLFRNKLLLCRTGRLSVHRGADRVDKGEQRTDGIILVSMVEDSLMRGSEAVGQIMWKNLVLDRNQRGCRGINGEWEWTHESWTLDCR